MPNLIIPRAAHAQVSHTTKLGTASYHLDDQYSPDSDMWRKKVIHLGPMIAKVPGYWWDRSRYQNHATITGATWIQQANGLWVMSLDGVDDYLNLGSMTPPNAKTFHWTGKFNAINGAFYSSSADTGYNCTIWDIISGTTMRFFIAMASGANYWEWDLTITNLLTTGVFYDIWLTQASPMAQPYVYINNTKYTPTQTTNDGSVSHDARSTWLGAEQPSGSSANRVMSEFSLYSKAFTDSEIASGYSAAKRRLP